MDQDEPNQPTKQTGDQAGHQVPQTSVRRRVVARRTARILSWPIMLVATLAVMAALVAAGVLPLFAGAGVAVKLADSKFLSASDRAIDLPDLPQRTTIYAADGTVLATVFRGQNREVFPLSEYGTFARDSVLAIEDHAFYQHGGVDLTSIVRALEANLRAGRVVQGGSTITQQLIKNTQTGGEQTLQRKIVEAQDALRLEKEYSKDQILEAYLNTIYMGNQVYGYGTAAQYYFNKTPSTLTLAQAALLAGLIAAPEAMNPTDPTNMPNVIDRRNLVLDKMFQYHYISRADHDAAVAAQVKLRGKGRISNLTGPEPYWVDYIRHLFLSDPTFGATQAERAQLWYQGGLQIHTTLNMSLQAVAEKSMRQHYYLRTDPQAAAVTIDSATGAIRVMANGNTAYGTGPHQTVVNLAWQALRGTGSAFKVFTLAAALEQGVQPTSQWDGSAPITITDPVCADQNGQPWTVHNSEGNLPGFHSLTESTALSINVVFAQLIDQIGPESVVEVAHRMGIERAGLTIPGTNVPYVGAYCATTLGSVSVSPLDMTTAYSTLANNGVHCMPYAISKIMRAGQTIYQHRPQCTRAIPADVAATENSMLEKVICCGTASHTAHLPDYPARPEAGKTGTDQNFQNAYFVGFVPQVTTGVWVGYQKAYLSLQGVHGLAGFGADMAGPVWTDIMTAATAHLPIKDFPTPPAPKSGTVPNVVGMQKSAAISTLANAGFSPQPKDGPCVQPRGIVCDQRPAGGSVAPLGTAVIFTVSNGTTPPPVQVTVPDVVGKTRDDATSVLTKAGFKVAVQRKDTGDKKKDGIVLSQAPAGGAPADQGSTVTIVVGNYKKGGGGGGGGQGSPGRLPWGAPVAALVTPALLIGSMRLRIRRTSRSSRSSRSSR